jgi:heme exporter protein CcmB
LSGTLNTIKSVIKKDLLIELRTLHVFAGITALGLLIAIMFRLACNDSDSQNVQSAVILVSILFASVLICERSFAIEMENDSINALLMAIDDAGDLYLSKVSANTIILCIFEIIFLPSVLGLFGLNPNFNLIRFIEIILLVNIAVISIGAIFAAMVQSSKAGSTLLSMLVMSAFLPLIIPSIKAISAALGNQDSLNNFNDALGLLVAYDAIYVTISWLLFDFVINE